VLYWYKSTNTDAAAAAADQEKSTILQQKVALDEQV
jgi:hypothetical protein